MSANVVADCDSWCITDRRSAKTTFRWTIKNFKDRPEEKYDSINSIHFSVPGPTPDDKKTEWYLTLLYITDEEGVDMMVYLHSLNDFDVEPRCCFSIVDSFKKEQHNHILDPYTFDSEGDCSGCCWIKFDELIEDSDNLLPDGHLTLLCKLEVFGQDKLYGGPMNCSNKTNTNDECKMQVINDLDSLFTKKSFSDLEIKCDEEVFHCHQNILSARCPVFLAMFQTDMVKNYSKTVIISDVKKEVFSEMLRFIYTGRVSSVDSLKELAKDLLVAANKYQLDLLKRLCEDELGSTLEESNCLELFVFGDIHQASKLKMAALESVLMNLASLSDTDVYKEFIKKYPELAFEVTKAMFSRKRSSLDASSDNSSRYPKSVSCRSKCSCTII